MKDQEILVELYDHSCDLKIYFGPLDALDFKCFFWSFSAWSPVKSHPYLDKLAVAGVDSSWPNQSKEQVFQINRYFNENDVLLFDNAMFNVFSVSS